MKAMTRKQLADSAGVSVITLNNWLRPYREQLIQMGMPEGKGLLPPNVVEWISQRYCIDTKNR